jgi:hypothetical protein
LDLVAVEECDVLFTGWRRHIRGKNNWLLSLAKRGAEHRQTALRLGIDRFILQNIPVFREHAVGHSDDIGGRGTLPDLPKRR